MSSALQDRTRASLALVPVGLVDASVLLVGLWHLYATAAIRVGLDFWGLLGGLVFPALATLVLFVMTRETEDAPAAPDHSSNREPLHWGIVLGTLAAAITALLVWRGLRGIWLWPFLAVVLHTSVLSWGRPLNLRTQSRAGWLDWVAIALAMVVAVTATLWIHRPENDDAFYLNQVLATLRYPDLAVLSFDGMHGDVTAPVQQLAHRAQTYELLVSVVTWATGLAAADVYYMGFPIAASILLPFATWVTAKALFGTGPGRVALLVCMGVMAIWGGHYYCYGNFAFSRMFQGKGQAVSIFLPLCLYYGVRFAERPDWRRWTMLMLAQSAAACFTSTALVVAPVAAALPVLAGLRFDRAGAKAAGAGLLSALPCVVMLGLIKLEIMSVGGLPGSSGHIRGLEVVLGANQRVNLALCALPLLPTIAVWVRAPQAAYLARFVLVTFLVLMNDTTTGILAELGGNLLSWRTYWAVPFPLVVSGLVGLSVVGAYRLQRPPFKAALMALGIGYAVAFYYSGRPSWAAGNFAELKWSVWRVPEESHSVAQTALILSDEDSVVLLHPEPSQRLTTFENHPTMVGVRRGYTRHLKRFYGSTESAARNRLLRFAEAARAIDDISWHMLQFDRRCIDVFVTVPQAERRYPQLRAELERRSFVSFEDFGYQVWYRGDKWSCGRTLKPLPNARTKTGPPPPPPAPKRKKRKKRRKKTP